MKEYEIVAKFYNACGGSTHAQTYFEEAELENTDDFVRMKHGKDFAAFTKEVTGKQTVYKFDNGSVTYIYEFTQV